MSLEGKENHGGDATGKAGSAPDGFYSPMNERSGDQTAAEQRAIDPGKEKSQPDALGFALGPVIFEILDQSVPFRARSLQRRIGQL